MTIRISRGVIESGDGGSTRLLTKLLFIIAYTDRSVSRKGIVFVLSLMETMCSRSMGTVCSPVINLSWRLYINQVDY